MNASQDILQQPFRFLADESTGFVSVTDHSLTPIYVNPAGLALVGLDSAGAATRLSIKDFFSPEDHGEIDSMVAAARRGVRTEKVLRARRSETGAVLQITVAVRSFENSDGSSSGLLFSSLESSEKVLNTNSQQEKDEIARLAAQLRHWSAVVESSNDAIITKDLNGTITSWNKSAERIFGYTAGEVIGKPVTILFPEDHINEETEIIRRIIKGEQVDHYETVRRKKGGESIQLSLTISPIRNAAGVVVGASKAARDISSQKAYEQRLIEQADELEQFAYVASHDLQEPLRKLSVYSNLLVSKFKDKIGPEAEKISTYITDAAQRMQTLIGELLDYSRANRSDVKSGPVDLADVMKGVLADLEFPIRDSQAVITQGTLPVVEANRAQMHQLLQNLISNALKFRSKIGPHIDVSSREENGQIVVSVKDDGIGMEPQYHDRIFRVFQRLHTGGTYPGTGIGLAICKKIAERNDGKIWVESAPGRGSTFSFSFPKNRIVSR